MIMKFHHIGIATNDINTTLEKIKKYFDIKYISNIIYDSNQDANLCMVTTNDGLNLELIEGKIVENLVKKKHYLYHTCYIVDDISKTIDSLINDGALLVKNPKEAILFSGKKVAFLMCNLGLIELLES